MRDFARLYTRLDATTSTLGKAAALRDYFASATDADAAWAVHFLSGGKAGRLLPTRVLRDAATRAAAIPEWLFEECYQAVGDLAETIAHLLPDPGPGDDRSLASWVEERLLPLAGREPAAQAASLVAAWRDLDTAGRFVWNKLVTGGFRVGVSQQLVARAVAEAAGIEPRVVTARLAGDWSPSPQRYRELVAAADPGPRADQPYPFFLAHPIDRPVTALGDRSDWHAEWKWDGIRIQCLRRDGRSFLWSRGDELLTERFPEIAEVADGLPDGTVIDGELLAWQGDAPLPFAVLQQRVTRKRLTARVLADAPVALMAYDLLEEAGRDLREAPFMERRARLAAQVAARGDARFRLSPELRADDWHGLSALREQSRERGVEGVMLKRRDSRYGAGRVKLAPGGDWWKWKVDPYSVDAVLVYAQRGHGRRASLYTDYTFAVWRGEELVPFAKAYSGLTDAEIREVDAFIRANTREKFGPVRSVTPALVMEIGFEGLQRSPRHKSGIAVRFPRILRLRPDKSPEGADRIEALEALLGKV